MNVLYAEFPLRLALSVLMLKIDFVLGVLTLRTDLFYFCVTKRMSVQMFLYTYLNVPSELTF